jgi:Domain of unknown function (DUF2383)
LYASQNEENDMQPHDPRHDQATNDSGIEKLQAFLRAELSAVETYELALGNVNHVGLHHALQEILTSHAHRAEQLRTRIGRLATEPARSSGVWGSFVKAFQVGADLLGDRAAIAALEQGEDRDLALYVAGIPGCDPRTQKLIETDLLPAQRRTHDLCRALKSYTEAPS